MAFDDPMTMALLGASAGFLDPNGGMLGGFNGAMNGYSSAIEGQRRKIMEEQMMKDAQDKEAVRQFIGGAGANGQEINAADLFKRAYGSGNPAVVQWALMNAPKLAPKVKAYNKVMGEDGMARYQAMMDNGTFGAVSDMPSAEKLSFQNMGGHTAAMNPFTGVPMKSYANSITPGQAASLAQDRDQFNQSFGLNVAKFKNDLNQQGKAQFKDGYWVIPPRNGETEGKVIETPISSPPKGSPKANQQSSERALPLIDMANELLDKSTGSYLGTGIDMAAQAFGKSTPGAQAASQLKALEGSLMMAQPRMEGPQSDKDTALYRQMAGQIGDSTLPVETRKAALKTIKQLHEKYAGVEHQKNDKKSYISPDGFSSTLVK